MNIFPSFGVSVDETHKDCKSISDTPCS